MRLCHNVPKMTLSLSPTLPCPVTIAPVTVLTLHWPSLQAQCAFTVGGNLPRFQLRCVKLSCLLTQCPVLTWRIVSNYSRVTIESTLSGTCPNSDFCSQHFCGTKHHLMQIIKFFCNTDTRGVNKWVVWAEIMLSLNMWHKCYFSYCHVGHKLEVLYNWSMSCFLLDVAIAGE